MGEGRYELCQFISKGGMGAVYKAHDMELGRWVAIKCLLEVEKRGARELAIQEARALASIAHPNIMRIYDILSGDDQVWIVSEWIDGKSLAGNRLPLSPGSVAAVMAQVYEALGAAHEAGIYHRDVKPSNVMLGRNGRVTLIDFGVAFSKGISTGETLAGSLRYTDPRILEGQPPDAWSDFFSAALMQIELMVAEHVLPDLAPLPLYRHAKKHLRYRIEQLLDGAFPPLADTARNFTRTAFGSGLLEESPGHQASLDLRKVLSLITSDTAEKYLASWLRQGRSNEDHERVALLAKAQEVISDDNMSPKSKAPWVAFELKQKDSGKERAIAPRQSALSTPGRKNRRLFDLIMAGAFLAIPLVGLWFADPRFNEKDGIATSMSLTEKQETQPDRSAKPHSTTAPKTVAVQLVANAWATVYLNDKEMGRLPQAAPFQLPPGRHKVRLESPLIQPFETEIDVPRPIGSKAQAKEATKFQFTLHPKVARHVLLLSEPGQVILDGKDLGFISKIEMNLPYGTHQIIVKREQGRSAPIEVAIGPESPKTILIK